MIDAELRTRLADLTATCVHGIHEGGVHGGVHGMHGKGSVADVFCDEVLDGIRSLRIAPTPPM